MHDYEHQQPGTLLRVTLGVLSLGFGMFTLIWLVSGHGEAAIWGGAIVAVFVVFLALFHSLTVRVSRDAINISFGVGLIRKSFTVDDIETAAIVRNHWYNGWGIRWIPGGWLYNVSGFDAVELRHKNGRRYRIGTDQPRELFAAIESEISAAG